MSTRSIAQKIQYALLPVTIGFALLAVATAFAADSIGTKSWVTIPGGLAEPAGKVAYVASAGDGIEAVDMESGQAIWESKEAQRPLALAGDQVIAQAPRGQAKINVINVVILDAPSGKVVAHAQPIILPDWVAVDGGIGLSFSSSGTIDGNELVLSWHAERQFAKGVTFAGGAPPTQEAMAAARKIESGIARVDLTSGVASVTLDRIPQPLKAPHSSPYYDVGDKRLNLIQSPENLPGGIRIIHCMLDARNAQTGRPLWKHEIAGEIILPDVPPTAQRMQGGDQSPRR
ncbi:MAG TPA: hypothetical protein VGJ04_07965 [Pirellulales bacterium]